MALLKRVVGFKYQNHYSQYQEESPQAWQPKDNQLFSDDLNEETIRQVLHFFGTFLS